MSVPHFGLSAAKAGGRLLRSVPGMGVVAGPNVGKGEHQAGALDRELELEVCWLVGRRQAPPVRPWSDLEFGSVWLVWSAVSVGLCGGRGASTGAGGGWVGLCPRCRLRAAAGRWGCRGCSLRNVWMRGPVKEVGEVLPLPHFDFGDELLR